MMICLSDEQIADWLDGRLSTETALELSRHVDSCAECRRLVASVASSDEPRQPMVPYAEGQHVGR